MAILTPLDLEGAQRLGALFGLDVTGVRGILAGSVNSNFQLSLSGGGRAFLRIYEEQVAASAAREAALLTHLSASGVATPRPMTLRGGEAGAFIAHHAGKPAAVFPWIDGDITCTAGVTPARAREVGRALARVHVAGEGFEAAPSTRFELAALHGRLDGVLALAHSARSDEVASAALRLRERLAALEGRRTPPILHGLIHGDLFRDNVLWQGESIAALLDFESASRGSRAFDLMVTVLAWCFGDDLDGALAASMAAGYSEVRPMPEEEREWLFEEATFAAVRFSITRITDFELRPRGTGVYKDYRRFLGRLDALDRLGRTGLSRLLSR